MLRELTEILCQLENSLDFEHLSRRREKTLNTLGRGENPEPVLLVYCDSANPFRPISLKTGSENLEVMLYNELCNLGGLTQIKDDRMAVIRPNYGTGTLPSLFGRPSEYTREDELPWVTHWPDCLEGMRALAASGIPSLDAGYGKRLIETYDYYAQVLCKWPNLNRCIQFCHADLQGPFDVLHMMAGSELFYAMYDEPELVHQCLSIITDTYIALMKRMLPLVKTDLTQDNYHWGTIYPGKALLREDTAVLLSKELYREFLKPYNERIAAALGGISIHYCGADQVWLDELIFSKGIKGVNLGSVMTLEYDEPLLRKVDALCRESGVANISYYLKTEMVQDIFEKDLIAGNTYKTFADTLSQAQALVI